MITVMVWRNRISMKYQISIIDDEGFRYVVAEMENLEQACARLEFIKDTNNIDNILIASPKWVSITLSQVMPISTSRLDIATASWPSQP